MAQRILNFADGFESSSSPSSSGSTGGGGEVDNLGVSLSAGLFKITAADGTALSGSNMGTIKMRSTTDGMIKTLSVDSDTHSFEDANGTSDIVGEEFGTVASEAWTEDRPFYLYAVNTDDTNSGVYFAISPNPSAATTGSTTNDIGYQGNPSSTPSDKSMFFLTSDNVAVAGTLDKPVKLIAGIRMQKDGSDNWTVQTVSGASGDGICDHPYVSKSFTFPQGVNGADANSYLSTGGSSTIPTWATPGNFIFEYKVGIDGEVECIFSTISAGSMTAGTGVEQVNFHLPYKCTIPGGLNIDVGAYSATGGQDGDGKMFGLLVNNNNFVAVRDSTLSNILANDFSAVSDDISGQFRYRVFAE